jgi:hypothetical protein
MFKRVIKFLQRAMKLSFLLLWLVFGFGTWVLSFSRRRKMGHTGRKECLKVWAASVPGDNRFYVVLCIL